MSTQAEGSREVNASDLLLQPCWLRNCILATWIVPEDLIEKAVSFLSQAGVTRPGNPGWAQSWMLHKACQTTWSQARSPAEKEQFLVLNSELLPGELVLTAPDTLFMPTRLTRVSHKKIFRRPVAS